MIDIETVKNNIKSNKSPSSSSLTEQKNYENDKMINSFETEYDMFIMLQKEKYKLKQEIVDEVLTIIRNELKPVKSRKKHEQTNT